ncbi:hypothetical protein [Pseudomonas sp. PL-6]
MVDIASLGFSIDTSDDFSGMRTAGEARESTATLARQVNATLSYFARYS